MSRMSEVHDDLTTIRSIMLGQRKVAHDSIPHGEDITEKCYLQGRVDAINDLLLEFEAAGIQWPDNVVTLHG